MSSLGRYYNVEDTAVSEEEKSGFNYLSHTIDFYIAALVREKAHIKQARNLYDGVRDKDEFRYLEETFGIETPLSIKMTPLIKTRIDVLIGIFLDEEYHYHVSVNDAATIETIEEQKRKEFSKRIKAKLDQFMDETKAMVSQNKEVSKEPLTAKFLEDLDRSLNNNFISEFEIAIQSLIKFFEQDPTINIRQKAKQFLLDYLLTGEAYYRTYLDYESGDPKLEICKPENMFFSKNTAHQFLAEGNDPHVMAVVYRTYMKRNEILNRWGHVMTDEQKTALYGMARNTAVNRIRDPRQLDHMYNLQDAVYDQHTNSTWDTLPIYHVEWLANNELKIDKSDQSKLEVVTHISAKSYWKDSLVPDSHLGTAAGNGEVRDIVYRLDRYEGIRVGWDLYLNLGKSKWQPRSIAAPYKTTLSYNGCAYNDRNSKPYSLALSLKHIQDSYDIITFFRDNLIANSGVDGSRVNLAAIPKVLGQDFMERILKFIAFRKQGLEIYDPTEEGANLFSHYGEFRGSLDGNVIQSLNLVLEALEKQADVVTGVNRYMYAAAEQRDAVTNVKTGIKQSSLITKDIFESVFLSRKNMLTDLVNLAKISYKDGKRGSYIVGHRTMLFNIQPENYRFSDFNIHINNLSKETLRLEKLNAIAPQLAGKGTMEDGVLIKLMLTDSTTEAVKLIDESMATKKEENNAVAKLQQQLQEVSNQAKQLQQQLEKTTQEKEQLEKVDREYKNKELEYRYAREDKRIQISEEQLEVDKEIAKNEVIKDDKIVQLEREQLYAEQSSGNAKEVRNNI
jgi:hypothetical protein